MRQPIVVTLLTSDVVNRVLRLTTVLLYVGVLNTFNYSYDTWISDCSLEMFKKWDAIDLVVDES